MYSHRGIRRIRNELITVITIVSIIIIVLSLNFSTVCLRINGIQIKYSLIQNVLLNK